MGIEEEKDFVLYLFRNKFGTPKSIQKSEYPTEFHGHISNTDDCLRFWIKLMEKKLFTVTG